ncbi:DUF2612 domain-containing protein [Photorhabdus noenieputensis]|uniref:DUF2612 domain-containing protein n=1 Tax=Photorhabdus aegyptia TaxID=2805098 RepID=A0A022PJI9_9GAMM|nr:MULTISPECIES: DUF2612 domain-containing protein [Photorhabdus]EYU15826.1 Protein of unknown function (DUF2612) [Photorhabdus aegyptia]MBS9435926.1 DUF2612 domain-containing protein [Photorhabdus noenieputensis]MCK3667511.1 DUF2612 domain-containing protein [Photorhabdus noenieputensis]
MENVGATILAQYAASPKLNSLILSFNAAVSSAEFINTFYDLIWNIDTANTYGLDVWGKIVNVSRRLTVNENVKYIGFGEALLNVPTTTDPNPFDQAPFYSGESKTKTIELSDQMYRKLIMMKAMSNISDCTIPNINRMLVYMFSDSGRAYITDDGNMKMSYVFEFQLSTAELAIVQTSGVLPYPVGVSVAIVQRIPTNEIN